MTSRNILGLLQKKDLSVIAVAHGAVISENAKDILKSAVNLKLTPEKKGSILARLFGAK